MNTNVTTEIMAGNRVATTVETRTMDDKLVSMTRSYTHYTDPSICVVEVTRPIGDGATNTAIYENGMIVLDSQDMPGHSSAIWMQDNGK